MRRYEIYVEETSIGVCERELQRDSVCVFVCMREREREREMAAVTHCYCHMFQCQ